MQARFKFTELIAPKLNKCLKGFQTDQLMIPFLSHSLKNIVSSLLNPLMRGGNKKAPHT